MRVEWIDGALGTWCGLGVGVRGVGGGMGGCLRLQILLRGRRGEGEALRFCVFGVRGLIQKQKSGGGGGVVLTVCQEEYLGSSALMGLEVGGWMVV